MKTNLQSYMKNASKEYVFDVSLDPQIDPSVIEKRLVGLGLSKIVGYKEEPGHFNVTLGYPIAGKDLLARLCENSQNPVRVTDNTGQIFSNHPIPSEEKKTEEIAESVEEPPAAPVIELKKTTATAVKETRFDSFAVAAIVSESLSKNLESLVTQVLGERSDKTAADISEMSAKIKEDMDGLRVSLSQIQEEMAQIRANVAETMDSYNRKLVELAESSNKLNHKVVKHVKRDANGFIVEVTEQITPER